MMIFGCPSSLAAICGSSISNHRRVGYLPWSTAIGWTDPSDRSASAYIDIQFIISTIIQFDDKQRADLAMVERSTTILEEGRITGFIMMVDMMGSRNSSGAMAMSSSSDSCSDAVTATRRATSCRSPIKLNRPIRPKINSCYATFIVVRLSNSILIHNES